MQLTHSITNNLTIQAEMFAVFVNKQSRFVIFVQQFKRSRTAESHIRN